MEKSIENTVAERKEKKDKLRFFVRLIGKDGQSSVTEFSKEDDTVNFAKENDKPKEGVYPHAYDREETDEKGNYKKIYPVATKKSQ